MPDTVAGGQARAAIPSTPFGFTIGGAMRITSTAGWPVIAGALLCWTAGAQAQGTANIVRSEGNAAITVTVEVFCSTTKIRTSNARLHWTLSPDARATNKLATLVGAKQQLETTVYANGFEKGVFVALQVPATAATTPTRVAVPATTQSPQLRQALPRSLRIRLIETRAAADSAEAAGAGFTAVVEDLEPGLNYTWRVAVESPPGPIVSAPVEIQAVACPVDEPKRRASPPTKPPPPKRPGARRP